MSQLAPSDRLPVAVGDLTPDGESEAGLAADEEAWTSAPTAAEPVEASAAAVLAPDGGVVDLLALSALDVGL